jgi:hypothetical protein
MCYYLYREINKTKADISTLKDFSGSVASFLERGSASQKGPSVKTEKTEEEEEEEVVVEAPKMVSETKKDD